MNVVFLCQRVPWPPDRGDRITTWHFLQHLLDLGASVRLGCFAEEERDLEAVEFLAARCDDVVAPRLRRTVRKVTSLRGLLTGEPLTLPFFRHRELAREVRRWLADGTTDLVYVYSSSMAQYVMPRPPGVSVMQFAELDSDKWRQFAAAGGPLARFVYGREAERLLRFETEVARAFTTSFVVSDVEKELFERAIPGVTAQVLPNGVDVERFASSGDAQREPHAAIFTGVMDYAPNVDGIAWFAERCWPALRARFPDARLFVVGSDPVAKVNDLARLPGIVVTGRVPATPPWFDRAAVAIAPLRLARGVQNKVLEALSCGVPVVASPQAAQGVAGAPAAALRTADGEAATIDAVAALFADPAAARAAGASGAAWVRAHCGWDRAYERLDAVLRAHGLLL